MPDLRIAHILCDAYLLELARREALGLIARDPHLNQAEHTPLPTAVQHKWENKLTLIRQVKPTLLTENSFLPNKIVDSNITNQL